jgi:hypothetical protein
MKKTIYQKQPFKRYQEVHGEVFTQWLNIYKNKHTMGSLVKRAHCLNDIINTNGLSNALDNYEIYYNSTSQTDKILLRRGKKAKDAFINKLKCKKKPKGEFSVLRYQYWMNKRGYSLSAAKAKVSELQLNNAKKRTNASYNNYSKKIKWSIDYWIERGYTKDEAIILREPYLKPCLNTLEACIIKYGKKQGNIKYKERINKYKESMQRNKHLHKTGGYVSNASLKFFIPLYKKIRKLGIARKDIYLGIDGSREFFIRSPGKLNTGRFFDFAIPSLNIIIEFHGVFWHPRTRESFRNPWITFDDAMLIEKERERLCSNREYEYIIVWSDSDLDNELNKVYNRIKNKYECITN